MIWAATSPGFPFWLSWNCRGSWKRNGSSFWKATSGRRSRKASHLGPAIHFFMRAYGLFLIKIFP